MAKDGTNRGGRRVNCGRKKDALVEKLEKGKPAQVMRFPTSADLMRDDFFLADMPEPSDYLSAAQRDGKPFGADDIYRETVEWLRKRQCADFVNPRLVESYAESFARYIQCSEAISRFGFVTQHPESGVIRQSPYVAMSLHYLKQANAQWYEIFQIVKENSLTAFDGNPQDDMMERLLTKRNS